MPTTALPPIRLYLELASERVGTLKLHHQLGPEPPQYIRFFLECFTSPQEILASMCDFAAHRDGGACEVAGAALHNHLVTVSLPLADGADAAQIVSLACDLLLAIEASIPRT